MLVGADRVALCGSLSGISVHRHASTAVVVGLDVPLLFAGRRSHLSRAALIAPGYSHAVLGVRGRIAAFLLPPHAISSEGLAPVGDLPHPERWVELGQGLLDGTISGHEPVDLLLARSKLNTRELDDRLRRAIALLRETLDDNVPVEEIAAEVRLSPSRLMSVAHEQLGTSLRRYRRWLRMFRVARDYAGGASLTRAALDAGFSSSAHLSAAARDHFGIRPSQILTPGGRSGILATPYEVLHHAQRNAAHNPKLMGV